MPPHHAVLLGYVGPSGPRSRRLPGVPHRDPACTRSPTALPNTLIVVEAAEPAPWTKPDDIPFGPEHAVRQQGLFRDGFRASFADGSRRFVRSEIDEPVLRAAVTRNGGEQLPPDW